MNPLLALLGAFNQNGQTPVPELPVEEVTVTGKVPSVVPQTREGPRNISNLDFLLERQAAADQIREAQRLPKGDPGRLEKPAGMFGIKGTLRDVLGTIGDAFLVQGGAKPVYAPKREEERMGQAMAGFSQDPLAAAERMTGLDNEMARQLQQQYENTELRRQNQESLNLTRDSQIERRRGQSYEQGLRILAAAKAAGVSRDRMTAIARQYGVDEDILDDPGFADSGMTVNQQRNLPLREKQVAISQQNADANTKRANRPPAGRAPTRPTASNIDAEVLQAMQRGTATPQQIKYFNERLKRGGGTKRRSPPPLPPGFKM